MTQSSLNINLVHLNVFDFSVEIKFDTALMNPPFGIQQKKFRDLDFIEVANSVANTCYIIIDGSKSNQSKIEDLLAQRSIKILNFYLDEFDLPNTYPWHKQKRKISKVLVLHTTMN